jgi:CubicO group peptidase (beta-lactamase class C family)
MLPLGLLLAAAVAAPPDPVALPADFAARAGAYMDAQVAVNDFTGVVLVAVDGRPLFRQAYGYANRDWDIPNTPDTKFRIASVTKQFTSAAILLLEQQGKLKATDPVGKHLPDVPKAWADVTLLQLMSHTGGVPEHTTLAALAPGGFGRSYRPQQIIDLVKDQPLKYTPGGEWRYSNTGYILLGMVIEAVSGKDYAAFMRESVFDPLGMADTGVERPGQVLRNRATGYAVAGGRVTAPYLNMSLPYAAGAMYSTADDLLKWDRALAGDRLLGPAARKTMFTPVRDEYACGVGVEERWGRTVHRHGGGMPGFNTHLLRVPAAGVCVVVLANRPALTGRVALDLAALALGEKYDIPRPVAPPPRRKAAP